MTDEEPVPQFDDDADTILEINLQVIEPLYPITCTPQGRAVTSSDWPPAPPLPADDTDVFAIGTAPPRRRAGVYAAVRRPTTSSEST